MTDIKSERCGSLEKEEKSMAKMKNPYVYCGHYRLSTLSRTKHNAPKRKTRKCWAFSKFEVAFISEGMYKSTKYCNSNHKIQLKFWIRFREKSKPDFFRESSTKWSWIEEPLVTRKMKIKNKKIQSRTPYTPSGHNTVA